MTVTTVSSGKLRAVLVAAMAALTLTGCIGNLGGHTYRRSEVGVPQESLEGVVISYRPIVIEGTQSGIGAGGGAIVGGALGSTVGGGDAERLAMGALGAIVGGVLGATVERNSTRRQGHEYTIQLDNGNVVTIAQQDEFPIVRVNMRARVLYGPGYVRVTPGY